MIGLSGLSVRLIYLHVIKANDYQAVSANASKTEVLLANRGCIVDCNNQLIARNIPRTSMAIDKLRLNNAGLAILAFSLLDNLGMNGGRNGFLYIQSLGKQDMTIAILYFVTTILIFINIMNYGKY